MDCYLYVHICTGAPCVGTLRGEPWDLGPWPLSTSGHHNPYSPGSPARSPQPGNCPQASCPDRGSGARRPCGSQDQARPAGWTPECVMGGGRQAWRASEVLLVTSW